VAKQLFERALVALASQSEVVVTLWKLYVSFMQDRSADIKAIEAVEARQSQAQGTVVTSRKRKEGGGGGGGASKHARTQGYGGRARGGRPN
jgi:hypothetical protein